MEVNIEEHLEGNERVIHCTSGGKIIYKIKMNKDTEVGEYLVRNNRGSKSLGQIVRKKSDRITELMEQGI